MKNELLNFLQSKKRWVAIDELREFGSNKELVLLLSELKKEHCVESNTIKKGYGCLKYFRYTNKIVTDNQLSI